MLKSVLITGGYGFLGRAVAGKYKLNEYRVVGIGHGNWTKTVHEYFGFDDWYEAEISIHSLSCLQDKFDVIVHCAGNGSVGYSTANPFQDYQKSVEVTANLLEYIRQHSLATKLIIPSSAAVYGLQNDNPLGLNLPLKPVSPYGFNKRIVEEMCECYSLNYGLRYAIIRFFSIYGPGLTKQLLWDACNKFMMDNGEAIFWGTGEETRDWINIDDALSLIKIASDCTISSLLLNGASGNRTTVKEVLELLRFELGSSKEIVFNNITRDGDPHFYHADVTSAYQLGWLPKKLLTEGIREYVHWYKQVR